jgi:AcrR family transcriptional regulator
LTKKTNSAQTEKPRRRRRKAEAAESEILNAAENFLREFPFRDMMIEDIMSRTGLSRPSFYEYFRDRNQLVIKLTERLGARNLAISEPWLRGQESVEDLRRVMYEAAEYYVTQGHLLRALSDAAASDRQVEAAYRKTTETIIDGVAQRIRADAARGQIALNGMDPQNIASALILMNEGYLIEKLGRRPQADPKDVADTLLAIWLRVLYGVTQ